MSISISPAAELAYLKRLLWLTDSVVEDIHDTETKVIYKESVDQAIADGKLSGEEKTFLEQLKRELCLPDEVAQAIYASKAKEYVGRRLDAAITDERLSPNEEMELDTIAKNLGVTLKFDGATKAVLDKLRLYWMIENGAIPKIDPGINLQRKERCHFMCDVEWHEPRRVTRRIRYSGPTLRIKIAKGLYWRAGDLAVQKVSEDVLAHIDSGRVYLTDKRMIFMGSRKNSTIRLAKVLDFTPYKNGVEIQREPGRSPFLKFEKDVDLFAMILGRAIRDLE